MKECFPSAIADLEHAPEAVGFGKAIIEFGKFGTRNGLKAIAGADEKLQELMRQKIIESAKEDVNKLADYKLALKHVQAKLREGFRVIIVSHSQGNFISNHLYRILEQQGVSEHVRQIQVAAPTTFSEDDKNRYVNGEEDDVAFLSSFHRPTDLELICSDGKKHNFIECYTGPDDSLERRSRLKFVKVAGLAISSSCDARIGRLVFDSSKDITIENLEVAAKSGAGIRLEDGDQSNSNLDLPKFTNCS